MTKLAIAFCKFFERALETGLCLHHPPCVRYVRRVRLRLKCDSTRAQTRFRLSAKRTSPFKSAGPSVQSNTGSRGVRISGSNAGYTMFRGSVKGTGYPLHSPVSPFTSPPVRHRVPSHFNWTLPIGCDKSVHWAQYRNRVTDGKV